MNRLIGNKVAERDIRDWLLQQGYEGNSARFTELELHAVAPPGWIQVFRFTVDCRDGDASRRWFGAMIDDERRESTLIEIFPEDSLRQSRLSEISAGLILRRGHRPPAEVRAGDRRTLRMLIWAGLGLLLTIALFALARIPGAD